MRRTVGASDISSNLRKPVIGGGRCCFFLSIPKAVTAYALCCHADFLTESFDEINCAMAQKLSFETRHAKSK